MLELAILLIFPAMMAFAAASDLFTMTISNRVSLILDARLPGAGRRRAA
jgi:prepilin peptidase CpaA